MSNSSHLLESRHSPRNRLREFLNHPGAEGSQARRFRMLPDEVPLPGQAGAGNKGCEDPRQSFYFTVPPLEASASAVCRHTGCRHKLTRQLMPFNPGQLDPPHPPAPPKPGRRRQQEEEELPSRGKQPPSPGPSRKEKSSWETEGERKAPASASLDTAGRVSKHQHHGGDKRGAAHKVDILQIFSASHRLEES